MATRCMNCGGHFTRDEMANAKPPMHSWPLTVIGQRVMNENVVAEDTRTCPTCGCRTLRTT